MVPEDNTSDPEASKRTNYKAFALVVGGLFLLAPIASAQMDAEGAGSGALDSGPLDATSTLTGSATGDVPQPDVPDAQAEAQADADAQTQGALDVAIAPATAADVQADSDAALALESDARILAEAQAEGLLGGFALDGDLAQGSSLSFENAGDAAILTNVQVGADAAAPQALFAEIRIDEGAQIQQRVDGAAEVHIWTQNAHAELRDDAQATMIVRASADTQSAFQLAADARVDQQGNQLWIRTDDQTAHLAVTGDGAIEVDSDNRLRVTLPADAAVRFAADADADAVWTMEQEAFAQGMLGAEAQILAQGDQAAAAEAEYSVAIDNFERSDARVSMDVSSDDPRPRIVTLDVDQDLWADANVAMDYDGQEAVRADSAADVYAASGSEPMYAIVEAESQHHAVVYVPGFSTHTLSFYDKAESSSGSQDAEPAGKAPTQQDDQESPMGGIALLMAAFTALAVLGRRRS